MQRNMFITRHMIYLESLLIEFKQNVIAGNEAISNYKGTLA